MDEPLPRPFSELRRFHIGGGIEENDGPAVGKRLDQAADESKLGIIQIVNRMKNNALEPL